MPITVLLVEDRNSVRQNLKNLLRDEMRIIGEATNGKEALEQLKHLKPDIVVMDIEMPVMDGIEGTRQIKKQYPGIKILILSMHDHESLLELLDAGADGYVLKNSPKEELIFAIKKIARDGIYIAPELTLSILSRYRSQRKTVPVKQKKKSIDLSERESEILQMIARGMTNVEMADKLFLSVRTIESHRKKMLEKTRTTNTATLIRYAAENGLLH
jgi:DNA-binding NarL/FixJ family response regulator